LQFLTHYAKLGETNPEAWHPLLMVMDSDGRVDLVKLHGELMAFAYVEQNSGQMPCSYRLTRAGVKALQQISENDEPGMVVDQAA
jgi:hypothetical protein